MITLPDFAQLKRNLARPTEGLPTVRLAVVADSTSQFAVQALRGYAVEVSLDLQVFEADYDQIDHQLLDPASELYAFHPHFVLVWQSTEKIHSRFSRSSLGDRGALAETEIARLRRLVEAVGRQSTATVLVPTLIEFDDGVFGSYAATASHSWLSQVRRLNLGLGNLARDTPSLFLVDLAALAAERGAAFFRDDRLAITVNATLSLDALPLFAKSTLDVIGALTGRVKKCLVLDLDNTLWGGVIGDDGIEGIELGDLGVGAAFTGIQRWAKQLKERGVILAVSSKNQVEVAKEVFEKHPDMVLRLEDIAVFQANWDNKVDNIRHIQSILEIGFDSMVFLDDNPVERMQVRQELPQLSIPELPEDPADWLTYLRSLNLFETASVTAEDASRTALYQQEAQRREVQLGYANEDEFLASLEMEATVEGFTTFNVPRVTQLIGRSNQFNLRTIRYTEDDVRRLADSPDTVPIAISLLDRFGNYGLISVLVGQKISTGLFIDTWLMSCRVLKRGVENLALASLVASAHSLGAKRLIGEYIPTKKNALVKDHYQRLGFEAVDGRWHLELETFRPRQTHIKRTER